MKDEFLALIIFGSVLFVLILIFLFPIIIHSVRGEGCENLGDGIYNCKMGQGFKGFMFADKLGKDISFYIHWEDSDVGGYSFFERVKEGEIFETGEVRPGIKYIIKILEVKKGNLFRPASIKILASEINYPGKCEILATWKYKCFEGQSTTSGSIVVEEINNNSVKMRAHPLQYEKEDSPILLKDSLWVLTPRNPSYPQNYIKILDVKENEYVIFNTLNSNPGLE